MPQKIRCIYLALRRNTDKVPGKTDIISDIKLKRLVVSEILYHYKTIFYEIH